METANPTVIVSPPVSAPALTSVPSAAIAQNKSLQGSVLVLIQFDVCEEINLDALRDIFGARRQEASFKHPAPGYVRFERAPVVEAAELLSTQGGRIAQIVRGEHVPLSDGEQQEIMQSRISYYPNDLAVISWNGAFLYDSAAGAETVIQLLEYANSQLLEFRHYDELLTRELKSVYDFMDKGSGIWARWRTARRASRLHTVLLDVDELTERADNAIKFLSDMFSARLYKVAASKIGVTDYKNLVNQKVHTAEELYRFMVDQFHQSRAFVLELMVVIILIIDLIWLFKGRTPV